jgi:LPXTG-motif cell wall-anchored protein
MIAEDTFSTTGSTSGGSRVVEVNDSSNLVAGVFLGAAILVALIAILVLRKKK